MCGSEVCLVDSLFSCPYVSLSIGERAPSQAYSALLVAVQRRVVTDLRVRCEKVVPLSRQTTSLITSSTNVHILRALGSGRWKFDGQARIPVAGSPSAAVGSHILVFELILFESKTVDESEKIDHDICGNWSLIPSWSLMKEASLEWTKMMGHAVPDRADTPAPLGWKKQCGRSCWSLCMAVAVETAETMMTRIRKKTVEKSVLRLRQGLEEWIFPQGKAARRENPEADALWCMCQCCSTILWLRRNRRCTRARATGSLLPSCQPVWLA